MDRFLKKTDWLESRLFEIVGWVLLSLPIFAGILVCLAAPVGAYDEAIPLVSARCVEFGCVPGVDFKSFYPPFYYYALAEGFRLVAPSFLIARIFSCVLFVAIIAAAAHFFRISFYPLRRLAPFMALPAAIAAAGMPIAVLRSPLLDYAAWPGFALALLSLLTYLISGNPSGREGSWLVIAGFFGGVSTLVRFNFGPYVLFVILADILLAALLQGTISSIGSRLGSALRKAILYVIPFGAVNLAFYVVVYGSDAVIAPFRIVMYSAQVMGSSRAFERLGPDTSTLFFLLFPCLWIAARKIIEVDRLDGAATIPIASGAVLTAFALVCRARPSVALWFPVFSFLLVIAMHVFVFRLHRAALVLLLLYTCMLHYFLSRADYLHAALLVPVVALTIPFLFASPAVDRKSEPSSALALKGRFFLAIVAATYLIANKAYETDLRTNVMLARGAAGMLVRGDLGLHISDRRRLGSDPTMTDEIRATEFVRRRTTPSTRIFVGVKDHSSPFTNDVLAYWLAERLPAITYINLDSAITSEERVQLDIVNQLQKAQTEWAILYDFNGALIKPRFDQDTPGFKELDDFLSAQFQETARFGRYSVVRRSQPLQGKHRERVLCCRAPNQAVSGLVLCPGNT